jgi:hypothetical protein
VLVKINESWVDLAALPFTNDVNAELTGDGAITNYRGQPGFVCLSGGDGRLVLVNCRHVREVRAAGAGTTIDVGSQQVVVTGSPEWVANLVNQARRLAA